MEGEDAAAAVPEEAWRRTTKPVGLSSVEGPLWPQITQS